MIVYISRDSAGTYLQLPLRQCLSLSVVQLKGKHCRKPHRSSLDSLKKQTRLTKRTEQLLKQKFNDKRTLDFNEKNLDMIDISIHHRHVAARFKAH